MGTMTARPGGNRLRLSVALSLLIAVGLASEPAAQPSVADPSAIRIEDLLGMWTGQWVADGGAHGGGFEMILTRDPADRQALVAQVTFIDGGHSDTMRHEGRLTRTGAYFGLVGGGAMVVNLEPGHRLAGEFAGGPDLPVRRGSVDLLRKS